MDRLEFIQLVAGIAGAMACALWMLLFVVRMFFVWRGKGLFIVKYLETAAWLLFLGSLKYFTSQML